MIRLARKSDVPFVATFSSLATVIREARRQRYHRDSKALLRQVDSGLWVYAPPPFGVPRASRPPRT